MAYQENLLGGTDNRGYSLRHGNSSAALTWSATLAGARKWVGKARGSHTRTHLATTMVGREDDRQVARMVGNGKIQGLAQLQMWPHTEMVGDTGNSKEV